MNLAPNIRLNKCGLLVLTCLFLTFCYYMLFSGDDHSHLSYVHKNVEGINMRKLLIGSIQAAQMGGIEVVDVSKTDFG